MNKSISLVMIVFIVGLTTAAKSEEVPEKFKNGGWFPQKQICLYQNKIMDRALDCSEGPMIMPKTLLPLWGGEAVEVYLDPTTLAVTKFKVSVKWVTDKSPYSCGKIVTVRQDEMKDFNRSLAMKKCN